MLKLLLGNPWVLVGIAGAFLLLGVWGYAEHMGRISAEKAEKAARLESGLHEADATRYQAATADRDQVILSLKAALDDQSAAAEAGRAKEAELRASLDSARQQNDRLQAEADQMARDLEDEAAKSPGDVRELGPIVLRRAGGLFK